MAVENTFSNLKEQMERDKIYNLPEKLFCWALDNFHEVQGDQFSVKSYSFRLFDRISQLEGAENIMRRVVKYADTLGIKPWKNVVGLRLEASTCLSEFIEECLEKNS